VLGNYQNDSQLRKSIISYNKTSATTSSYRDTSPKSYFKSSSQYMKRKKYVEKIEEDK